MEDAKMTEKEILELREKLRLAKGTAPIMMYELYEKEIFVGISVGYAHRESKSVKEYQVSGRFFPISHNIRFFNKESLKDGIAVTDHWIFYNDDFWEKYVFYDNESTGKISFPDQLLKSLAFHNPEIDPNDIKKYIDFSINADYSYHWKESDEILYSYNYEKSKSYAKIYQDKTLSLLDFVDKVGFSNISFFELQGSRRFYKNYWLDMDIKSMIEDAKKKESTNQHKESKCKRS